MKIIKGYRVVPSGEGRTKTWKMIIGTVTKRRGTKVYVHWDGTSFEDEMDINEIKISNKISEK